jgi:hypothetical protein
MRIFSVLILLLSFTISITSQEAVAIKPISSNIPYFNSGEYDNALFTNINLSGNTAPQNEPSVRISRVNPNIVVAAWRDFRSGIQTLSSEE